MRKSKLTCKCKPSPFGDSLIMKKDGAYCPQCGKKRVFKMSKLLSKQIAQFRDDIKKPTEKLDNDRNPTIDLLQSFIKTLEKENEMLKTTLAKLDTMWSMGREMSGAALIIVGVKK